ncbi:MAG TPA: PAS domain S-box protein, partial [Chloroflexi bacterium]|nr:PAS domain S-box protein [Chloroflexota bacterium]
MTWHSTLHIFPLLLAAAMVYLWLRRPIGGIMPVARDVVIEKLSDGVIVLDAQGCVVDLNPAARQIIGEREEPVVGRLLCEISPNLYRTIQAMGDDDDVCRKGEIALDREGSRCIYDVRVSPLLDWRGQRASQAIVVRDVTVREKVTEEIAQWMLRLASLQEIGVGLAAQLDLDTLLQSIPLKAIELLDADGGALALYDPKSDVLTVVATVGDALE